MSQVPSTSTSSTDFEAIFAAALKAYREQTDKDITSHPLATQLRSCDSPDAIIAVLRDQVLKIDQSQGANEKWTKWLDPTVNVLSAFNGFLNVAAPVFPPAAAIFTGIGILLQAIKDVRAGQDALIELFGRIEFFFKRLEAYIKVRPTAAMMDIIVKIMVEVISIFGIVTREIGRGRFKKYLKTLFGLRDVADALQRLDKLTQEEVRMAAAETMRITRDIRDTVKDVDKRLVGVDERVQCVDGTIMNVDRLVKGVDEGVKGVDDRLKAVDDRVKGVDDRVKGVDDKVSLVIKDVMENGVVVQQVVNQIRNELRKDLRKWITPPDPSVNYNAACGVHHEGTASWCTKGNTLAEVVILRDVFNDQSILVVKNFAQNAGGWLTAKHTRLVADVTGDKKGDIVGFGEGGVWISINNGNNTFTYPPKMVIADFAYSAGGWRIDKHILYMADIRNVGRADIVGFGGAGVLISRNNGGLNFSPGTLASNDFGYNAGGWRLDRHLRFLADVTGDGCLDIVGFGESHVFIGRNNGNGTFAPAQSVIDNFCVSAGWKVGVHPRFVADLTGDGRADIIGCGGAGCWASLNNGSGGFGPVNLVINNFGTAQGWQVDKHPRFVADLTGDKRGDVIGFGDAGVYVALNNGNGTFQPVKFALNNFGVQQGWMVSKHPRFVVDLTGDGFADIIGFGDNSTFVSFNDGKGNFGPVKVLTDDFSFSGGKWAVDTTVRWMANLD